MKIVVMIPFGMTRTLTLIVNQYLWIVYLVLPLLGNAQKSTIDSLQKVLISLPPAGRSFGSDTTRVGVLCEMGRGKDKNGLFIGDYKQCIGWLSEAEKLSLRIKWNKGLLLSNLYAGTWHSWKGYSLKGLQKKQQAVYYAELEQNPYWLGRAYRHLGDHYYLLRNYEKSIYYLTKALIPSKDIDPITYLIALQSIGTSYYGKGDYKNALSWLEKAYILSREIKNEQMLKYVILNWAEVCLIAGELNKLEQLLEEYPSIKFEDKAWDVHYYTLSSKRFLLKRKYEKSLSELLKGLNYSNFCSNQHRQELFLQLANVYELLGNAPKSLYFYKQYNMLWEKDVKEFEKKQAEYLKYEYENKRQQDAIRALNQDVIGRKKNQKMLLYGVILIFLLGVFLFVNNRILNRKNKLIKKQHSELEVLQIQINESNHKLTVLNEDLEQKVLQRTQDLFDANQELIRKNKEIQEAFVSGKTQERKRVASELHDNLGGTLSGLIWQLQSVIPEDLLPKEKEIYDGLIQQMRNAYNEIRYISHNLIPSELEKGFYVALQSLLNSLNNNREIKFELYGNYLEGVLNKQQEVELYSICLELITNTIKHSNSRLCIIQIDSSKDLLEICFKDNGKGFEKKHLQKRGKGLINIQSRVESLNGDLSVDSELGQGACFIIKIPLTHIV